MFFKTKAKIGNIYIIQRCICMVLSKKFQIKIIARMLIVVCSEIYGEYLRAG